MIPKIIHYCWFGGNPKPKLALRCIASWKKYCPDFEIMEWNEANYDIANSNLYVRQAYDAKKWAFVSDFVRLDVVATYGGVYFDTDVELIKSIDDLLNYSSFFCTQNSNGECISTGLGFGGIKNNQCVTLMRDDYLHRSFYVDGKIDPNLIGCPESNTAAVRSIIGNLRITDRPHNIDGNLFLPRDYFCPLDYATMLFTHKTENTRGIHWYGCSWFNEAMQRQRKRDFLLSTPQRLLMRLLGMHLYEQVKINLKKLFFLDKHKFFPKKQDDNIKRIAIIAPGGLPIPATEGGAVETLIDLFLSKCSPKLHIDVFSSSKKLKKPNIMLNGNTTYYQTPYRSKTPCLFQRILLHFRPWLYYHWYLKYIQTIFFKNRNEYDAVLIENQAQFVAPIRKIVKCPIYLHLHNEDWHLSGWGCRSISKQVTCIITVSKYIENFVKNHHPDADVRVIYNGINVSLFQPRQHEKERIRGKYGIPVNSFAIFFAGRICKDKGIEEVLKAFLNFPLNAGCVLVVIGSSWFGKTEEDDFFCHLRQLAEDCKNPIIFTGFLQNSDVAELESVLDVAVLPSLWNDPFPLSVLEAMASGVPVITTKSGGIPESVTAECGFLLERDEKLVINIFNSIIFLKENIQVRMQMGTCARHRAENYFSSEMFVKGLQDSIINTENEN